MTCGRRVNGPLIHRGCTKSRARSRDIPSATLVGVPKGLRQPLELSLHNEAIRAAIVFGPKLKVALHFSRYPSLPRVGDAVRLKVVEAETVDKPRVRVARDLGSETEAEKRHLRRLAKKFGSL